MRTWRSQGSQSEVERKRVSHRIRLENSGVFNLFRRTPDFRVLCVSIQETVEEGEDRLRRVRESFNPT